MVALPGVVQDAGSDLAVDLALVGVFFPGRDEKSVLFLLEVVEGPKGIVEGESALLLPFVR